MPYGKLAKSLSRRATSGETLRRRRVGRATLRVEFRSAGCLIHLLGGGTERQAVGGMQSASLGVVTFRRGACGVTGQWLNEAMKVDREKLLYSLERDVQLATRGEEEPYSNSPLKREAFMPRKR
jgi:hypothetical protein